MDSPKKYTMTALTPSVPSVATLHPDWLTFLMPGHRREFPRHDLFAARFGLGRLDLYLLTGQVLTLGDSDPYRLFSEVLDAARLIRLNPPRKLGLHTSPSLAADFKQRCDAPEPPADWQLPAPWALLQEFALNLHAVEDVSWSAPEDGKVLSTLILKTYRGPAFRLQAEPTLSVTYEAAIRARSTFKCPEVETIIVTPATEPSSLAHERLDPTPFTTGAEKFRKMFPGH